MNTPHPDLRIAVLSDNGIERDARILKEIAWAERQYSTVHSFSLRQRGEVPVAEHLSDHALFRAAHKPMSKSQAQAAMAGIPALRAGHPPEITLKRAHLVLILLLLLTVGLALGTSLGTASLWSAGLAGFATLVVAVLTLWVQSRHRALAQMTEVSPKTGQPMQIFERYASQYKQSHALIHLIEAAIRADGPYDILHCHELVALESGVAIKRKYGGKLIWDTHEIYEDMPEPDPGLAAVARKTILEATPEVDAVITVTRGLADYYHQTHPELPEATVVMNAAPRTEPVTDDGRLRTALDVAPDTRILFYQGVMTINRGLPTLIDAAALLPEGWVLAMIGDGPLKPELEAQLRRQTARLGRQRAWLLPGVAHAELAHWTVGATLGVMPYENTALNTLYAGPNKLWEFPAAGVPFIAPRLPEIERIVERYGTGFLMPMDFDAQTIADRVAGLSDAELAQAREAGAGFLDEMSWERFTPRLGDVYAGLINREGVQS